MQHNTQRGEYFVLTLYGIYKNMLSMWLLLIMIYPYNSEWGKIYTDLSTECIFLDGSSFSQQKLLMFTSSMGITLKIKAMKLHNSNFSWFWKESDFIFNEKLKYLWKDWTLCMIVHSVYIICNTMHMYIPNRTIWKRKHFLPISAYIKQVFFNKSGCTWFSSIFWA